jgi:hypothetical protein
MLSTWEQKEHDGATRLACTACGAHTLMTEAQKHVVCHCCGGFDLHSVAVADAAHHGSRTQRHATRGLT